MGFIKKIIIKRLDEIVQYMVTLFICELLESILRFFKVFLFFNQQITYFIELQVTIII